MANLPNFRITWGQEGTKSTLEGQEIKPTLEAAFSFVEQNLKASPDELANLRIPDGNQYSTTLFGGSAGNTWVRITRHQMPHFNVVRVGFREATIDADSIEEAIEKAPNQEFGSEFSHHYIDGRLPLPGRYTAIGFDPEQDFTWSIEVKGLNARKSYEALIQASGGTEPSQILLVQNGFDGPNIVVHWRPEDWEV